MYQPPICKNDRCSKLTPPSLNPGVKRKFCSTRCARQYHARLSYQREAGKQGGGLVFVNELGQAQVNRQIALTAKSSEIRYKAHLLACALHGGPCPAQTDPYGRKKLCIVAAVFGDDWSQLKDAEEGKPIRRYSTTTDGRWQSDLSEAETAGIDERPAKGSLLSDAERAAAFLAGAGKKEDKDDTSRQEALDRYNEGLPFST